MPASSAVPRDAHTKNGSSTTASSSGSISLALATTSRKPARTSSVVSPGSIRQSTFTWQLSGTKFTWEPPSMTPMLKVGLPTSGSLRRLYAGSSSSSMRTISRAILVIALTPRCGLELWAALPLTTRSKRTTPLCARMTARSVGSAITAASTSRCAARCRHPSKKDSSSTVPAYAMVRGGVMPASRSRFMAWIMAAPPALVSHDPRPYSRPSRIRGSSGGIVITSTEAVSM